ncbi:nickel-dependent lactate racemase [bacterium]|nr:nickel-dependent lactate racemase [bacterium]
MKLGIPYGKDLVEININEDNLGEIIHPNTVTLGDEKRVLFEAMENPIGTMSFDQFVDSAKDILFIVNDGTRPTPTAKILNIIYDKIKDKDIKFIIATGVHRAPTQEEYEFIFGDKYALLKDRIYVHDSRKDEEMVHIGTSKNGTEMYVNRMGVDADSIVIIGSVEPHYFAGYTGGRKSFLPGIASYKTIEQNHKYALRPESKALALEGNPVHEDMIDALKTIREKRIFSIQSVLDKDRKIYAVTAGEINDSFYAAIDKANEVFVVKVKEKADIVVSVAPYPMDVDLYQSQKALDNGKLALKDGGILILIAKCRTGIGEDTFYNLLCSEDTPECVLDTIDREYKLGYHKAGKMAEIFTWSQVWGVTDLEDPVLERIFIKPYHSIQKAIDEAIRIKGPEAKVLFLMDGSITVPMIEDK